MPPLAVKAGASPATIEAIAAGKHPRNLGVEEETALMGYFVMTCWVISVTRSAIVITGTVGHANSGHQSNTHRWIRG